METAVLGKDLPLYQKRLHYASSSQSLMVVQKSYACSKKQISMTPRRGQILSENHPLCQKSHMLQLIRQDECTTPLGIGPAVMVRPWKLVKVTTVMLDLTGTEARTENWNRTKQLCQLRQSLLMAGGRNHIIYTMYRYNTEQTSPISTVPFSPQERGSENDVQLSGERGSQPW